MHSECPLRISSYTEPNLCRAMPPQLHHRHGSKDSLSTQLGDLFGHLGPAFLLTRRAQVAKGTLHSTLAAFCVYKGAGFARAKFMVYWTQTRQHGRLKRRFHCFSDFGRQGWRVHWRGWHKGMNWRDVELAAVACSPIHWGNGNLKLIEWVIIVLQPRRWFHHTCRGSGKVPSSSLSLFHPNIPDQAVPRWNCWGRIWFVWNQAAKWLGIRYLGCQGHLQCGQGLPKSFNQCLVAKSFQPILNHRFQKKAPFPYKTFLLGAGSLFKDFLVLEHMWVKQPSPLRANQVLQLSLTTTWAAFLSSLLPGNSVVGNYFLRGGFCTLGYTGTHELVVTKWKLWSKFKMFFVKYVLSIKINMNIHTFTTLCAIYTLPLALTIYIYMIVHVYLLYIYIYMYQYMLCSANMHTPHK